MSAPLLILGTAFFGLGSAIVPVFNAEAYAAVIGAREPIVVAIAVAVALALGQTAGKLLLFEAARRGGPRLNKFTRRARHQPSRWTERARSVLDRKRTGVPLVLASSSLGLPPLAVVALAAGSSRQSRIVFAVVCLLGRTARFAVVSVPTAWALA